MSRQSAATPTHPTFSLVTHCLRSQDFQPLQGELSYSQSQTDSLGPHILFILEKLPTDSETAKLLVENDFRLHGIPVEIVSERWPQFTSQVWKVFCIALWAKLCLSSGYHLQTNRQTERLNQEFETTLRCVSAHNPKTWSTYLSDFVHHRFEASLKYQPPLFLCQQVSDCLLSLLPLYWPPFVNYLLHSLFLLLSLIHSLIIIAHSGPCIPLPSLSTPFLTLSLSYLSLTLLLT